MKAAEVWRWWKSGVREPEAIFFLFCFCSTNGENEKRLIMALEFPSEWRHFHIGMEWVHIHRATCLDTTHTEREERMRRKAIWKWDSIPLWPNQWDWRSNLHDYKHTQSIQTHFFFFRRAPVGSEAKWNNSTCRLSRESTTPISSLFRFVPTEKKKGKKHLHLFFLHRYVSKGMEDTGASYNTFTTFDFLKSQKNVYPTDSRRRDYYTKLKLHKS